MKLEKKILELDYCYKTPLFKNLEKNFDSPNYKFKLCIKKIFADSGITPGKYAYNLNEYKLKKLYNGLKKELDEILHKFETKKIYELLFELISYRINQYDTLSFINNNFKVSEIIYKMNYERCYNIYFNKKILLYIMENKILAGNIKGAIPNYKDMQQIFYLSSLCYKIEFVLESIRYKNDLFYILVSDNYNLELKNKYFASYYKYNGADYDPDSRIINKAIKQEFLEAFRKDMGFDINDFIEISSCLCSDLPVFYKSYFNKNVVKISKSKLIDIIEKINQSNLSRGTIEKVINYLIIDEDYFRLEKKDSGRYFDNENVVNKISDKPIVDCGEFLIYSPALVAEVYKHFKYSILMCKFSYNVDIPNINKVVKKIKKKREKQLVFDAAEKFRNLTGGKVYVEEKLYNINSMINRIESESVGDYDILVIDENCKTIYNVEVKDLSLFSTIYEMNRQYHNFYYKHNYEEKFYKRVEYLKKELSNVTNIFEYNKYSIINIILTNKHFLPIYSKHKDVIYLSYGMLEDYIKYSKNKIGY